MPMEKLIYGLWGFFFGITVVILAGALVAYARSLHRIALNAGLTALLSAFYAVAFLGGLPIDDADTLMRFLAFLTASIAGFLNYQFLLALGMLKEPGAKQRALIGLLVLCLGVLIIGWLLSAHQALAISTLASTLLALCALGDSLRSAIKDERLAWVAVVNVFSTFVGISGLAWIALDRENYLFTVHVVTAVAATFYVASLAYIIWTRYEYLIELHEVMAHGPGYDPVTRMRSHQETGQMVGDIFKNFRKKPSPMGVVVLTIANLYMLEQLHGAAAVNNAFFVCAGRLRRWVPRHVEMGRLGTDGFVLIMQNCTDSKHVIDMARAIEARLRRSVKLNTSREVSQLGAGNTVWVAEIGVGVLMIANPQSRGSDAIAMGRRMSRTAISYASRSAWFDHSSGETVELPDIRLL